MRPIRTGFSILALSALPVALAAGADDAKPKPGDRVVRTGDEIVACGQLFHTTAPVKLWTDPGGYDAYRIDHRFGPQGEPLRGQDAELPKPLRRYGSRRVELTPEQKEQVRGGGWDLPLLQEKVDQFVIHFDVCGSSQKCFEVLHDQRGLSVQFMLDVDGTIYQTLDLKEAAWHATKANSRSIGIEIANVGTFQDKTQGLAARWYGKDDAGKTRLTIPDPKLVPTLAPGVVLRPDRDEPITGVVQDQQYSQYDLTPQQYESLTKLTATLCKVFPKIRCDYPKDDQGRLIPRKLEDDVYDKYNGILGHYHVQLNKNDPGPAFQWDRLIGGAKALMSGE
jgi:N-acetyl-anhydromuramyl-L-alanine amidase AmpD